MNSERRLAPIFIALLLISPRPIQADTSIDPSCFQVRNAPVGSNTGTPQNPRISYNWDITNNCDTCAVVNQQILRNGEHLGRLITMPFCPFVLVAPGATARGSIVSGYGHFSLGNLQARECREVEHCGL